MVKYTGYKYGGCPVWRIEGQLYKMISKHRTREAASKQDNRPTHDNCDKIVKAGKWYGRFNKLPKSVVDKYSW